MNMDEILKQWDNIQAKQIKKKKEAASMAKAKTTAPQISHKKANAPSIGAKTNLLQKNSSSAKSPALKTPTKASTSSSTNSEKTQINPIEFWLRRYGTIDKDKIAEQQQQRMNQYDRNYLLNMKPEARLDLHGLHQDEAEERLNTFITESIRHGLKKVIILNGKGIHTTGTDPVLGNLVRRFIEQDKRCGMSGHPKQKQDGGTGATWVILK